MFINNKNQKYNIVRRISTMITDLLSPSKIKERLDEKAVINRLPFLVQRVKDAHEYYNIGKKKDLKKETARFKKKIQKELGSLEEQLEELGQVILDESNEDSWAHTQRLNEYEKVKKQYMHEREKTLQEILPEAFAVVQESIRRFHKEKKTYSVLGEEFCWDEIKEAYPVQLLAAESLSQHKVAEQKTGEGKTLTAVFAAYLNALDGKGVHIVTPNDYLAARDAETMGPLLESIGISVGCIDEKDKDKDKKREIYHNCDIIYGSNAAFAFDFLRNNTADNKEDTFFKHAYLAIIDEVDNILIDKARTPHILSGGQPEDGSIYKLIKHVLTDKDGNLLLTQCPEIDGVKSKELDEKYGAGDFIVTNDKIKKLFITEQGEENIKKLLGQ